MAEHESLEFGKADFVLLDNVSLEEFMTNLKLRQLCADMASADAVEGVTSQECFLFAPFVEVDHLKEGSKEHEASNGLHLSWCSYTKQVSWLEHVCTSLLGVFYAKWEN
ncbi:hypothetical protein NQZ68_025228 [Dissostichus eleginoides]|nr:hypothetical protein NQZ68_025228 [Dissostichus eleginoides]